MSYSKILSIIFVLSFLVTACQEKEEEKVEVEEIVLSEEGFVL